MKNLRFSVLLGAALFPATALFADITVTPTASFHDEKTGLTLVVGEIDKLENGRYIEQPTATAPVSQVMFILTQSHSRSDTGNNAVDEDDDDNDAGEVKKPAPAKPEKLRIMALLRDKNATETTLTIRQAKHLGDAVETLRWNLSESKNKPTTNRDFFRKWAHMRANLWATLTSPEQTNLLPDIWAIKMGDIYDAGEFERTGRDSRRWRRNRDNDASDMGSLAVFGGQAAIRETLQTQKLRERSARSEREAGAARAAPPGDAGESEPESPPKPEFVDVSTLTGVDVKAHPYAEMLAAMNPPAPVPSLADYAPPDRFFALIREPRQVAALLSGADDTTARLTPVLGERFADHALLARYTARFGLTPEQARQWFSGGSVAEVALIAPDVFFRDSTDLTFVIRLKPGAFTPFSLAKKITGELSIPLADGSAFHLASRDDLLFLSTNKNELDRVLAFAGKDGAGSLGRLDEFRVMSQKLPFNDDSRVFVYFSDPFIRRLTGPEVKIGQFRRATARAHMEWLSSIALLYRLDHGVDAAGIAELEQRGYLAKNEVPADQFSLEKNCRVVSKEWGTLERLKTLTENPATQATSDEADSYNDYRERYTSFWRQFFDPIAVRLDMPKNGSVALETFILPLIDNSLYAGIKETLGTAEATAISVPEYNAPAIAQLAFKVPEANRLSQGFLHSSEFFKLYPFLPLLGDTAVLTVRDSAPVVQSNFPGITSFGERGGLTGMRGEELFAVPVVAAMITRPSDLAIRVTDEAKARELLRGVSGGIGSWALFEPVFIEKENRLIFSWTLENIVRLEFGASVENGWLHLTNHPWTPTDIVGTKTESPAHARITLSPSELKLGLPQALSAAQSAYRDSVYASAADLLPWMTAYDVDVTGALKLQQNALGRTTPVPPEVVLSAKDFFKVEPYGTWTWPRLPATQLDDTGLLRGIQNVNLRMGFEDDGLRTHVEFVPAVPTSEK